MIGAVASLFVMFGAAQNPSVCLAFDDALTAAADNDPAVDIARADLANAQAGLEEARSLYRPQLSAFARTGVGDTGLVDSQFENQFGFRASQRVFDFGDAGLARRATREGVNARKSDVLGARDEAALSAGVAFLNWSRATEQLAATAERGAYFERQLEAVEEALAEGGATVVDRAEVASEKAAAEAARFELELGR
ncbi:MAG: TolC family protein, partial [Pseudomonadota bacterium]